MSATRITSVSPRRPDDVVADEPAVAASAVARAADRARNAQGGWAAPPTPTRAQALHRAAEAVPPPELTLSGGDVVGIAVAGVGTLVNPVEVVGTARPRIPEEAPR